MRFAIVNNNNHVVSIVVWEKGEFKPPRNHTVIQSDIAQPNCIYDPIKKTFFSKKDRV